MNTILRTFISICLLASINLQTFANTEENFYSKKEYGPYDSIGSFKYSQDGKSFTFVVKKDGNAIFMKDGIEKIRINGSFNSIIYSPDGKSFAFLAIRGGKTMVIKDGIESNLYKWIDNLSLTYSPDSKSFAFVVNKDGKFYIVKDGVEINSYNGSAFPTYSPDSKSFAFISKKNNKYVVIKDGIESVAYDNISDLTYSPDSKSLAFIAKKDKKFLLVRNGIESRSYDELYLKVLAGENYVFIAEKDEKSFIIRDGVEEDPYDSMNLDSIKFSPDGRSLSYIAKKNSKYVVVKDKIESNSYSSIGSTMYSPDSKSFVFWAEKKFLVRDGVEGYIKSDINTYDDIYHASFSPDSKSFIFLARKTLSGGQTIRYLVKDGIEIATSYYNIDPLNNSIKYSPDGKVFAFTTMKDGKYFVIKDGVEYGPYDNQIKNLTYSSDGKSLAFIIKKYDPKYDPKNLPNVYRSTIDAEANAKYFVIKDGVEYGPYNSIISMMYSPDGKSFSFTAMRYDIGYKYIPNATVAVFEKNAKLFAKYFIIKDGVESSPYDSIASITYSPDGKNFAFVTKKNGKATLTIQPIQDSNIIIKGDMIINKITKIIKGKGNEKELQQKYIKALESIKNKNKKFENLIEYIIFGIVNSKK